MKKLKVGIIGLGIGSKHIDPFMNNPYSSVTHLCDFSEKKLSLYKNKHKDLTLTKDASDLLNNKNIDIISIASYDNYHFEQVISALQNNKHVFVEKPICLFPQEATKIKELLDKKRELKISSNLNLRSCPRFINLKNEILNNALGDIFYVESSYLWGRPWKLIDGWRNNLEFYSIIYGAAIHMIDLVTWLIDMKPKTVTALGNKIALKNTNFKFNDFSALQLNFENGLVANITASGACVHQHYHKINVFGSEKTFLQEAFGSKWISKMDMDSYVDKIDLENYPAIEEKGNIINSFINSILDESIKPIVTDEDIFSTMSICFASEKSIKENRTITIEYI